MTDGTAIMWAWLALVGSLLAGYVVGRARGRVDAIGAMLRAGLIRPDVLERIDRKGF